MTYTPVLIVIGVMLVVGTLAAVVWWQMADLIFPGASKKTGQTIFPGRKPQDGPPPGATVIKPFEDKDAP